ncbi:MAG: carboxypeptidase-like regulatory domain-containing protein [Terriglobia bacterium]
MKPFLRWWLAFIVVVPLCFPGNARGAQSTRQAPWVRPNAAAGAGSLVGTVVDVNGAGIPGAQVTLTNRIALQQYTVISGENGEFNFTTVPPGSYFITIKAKGFGPYTSTKFIISARQVYKVPTVRLPVAMQKQVVVVRPTSVIAQMQMKAEEKQRVLGIVPNFYTSYVWNAAPLDTKQKFSLATRDIFDPVSLIGVAASAGIEQANNSFAGYGQGAAGYGRRFGAALGDVLIGGFVSAAVFPSIFHQDPRYFYQGSGSFKSRLVHALSYAVIARSDTGRTMPDYSDLLGDLTAGAISNLYYPPANRGAGLLFTNFGTGIAARAADNVVIEFLSKRFTTHVPGNGKP